MLLRLFVMLAGLWVQTRAYTYYYYYYYPSNLYSYQPAQSNYQIQLVLVNTPLGSYYKQVLVPIVNALPSTLPPTTPTTTSTTTTTTTRPPPPKIPELSPAQFFSFANNLPMQLYSNYLCGIYSSATYVHTVGRRNQELSPVSLRDRFGQLATWLLQYMLNKKTSPQYKRDSISNNNKETRSTDESDYTTVEDSVYLLRYNLMEGFPDDKLTQLQEFLNNQFNSTDLFFMLQIIYGQKLFLAQEAISSLRQFYVNDPSSTSTDLAESDLRRIYIDFIVAANGRSECLECEVNFSDSDQLTDVVSDALLPRGYTEEQSTKAKKAIKALSSAHLSASGATKLIGSFVHEFSRNSSLGLEDYVSAVTMTTIPFNTQAVNQDDRGTGSRNQGNIFSYFFGSQGKRKRSLNSQTIFDKQIACFILNNYARSSPYCGVRISASQIYSFLGCSTAPSPLQPSITPAPTIASTTSTSTTRSTTRTTTTTRPTTTTTRPTTRAPTTRPTTTRATTTTRTTPTTRTTTRTPPTTTTTTTTTTTPTTTTTATTTTPTTTTTTTTTPTTEPEITTLPPVPCGVSSIATRSVSVTDSGLFVTPRVVGGVATGTCQTYPWLVRLTVNNAQVCGGAILSSTRVVTAAHCVCGKYSIQAVIGEYDSTQVEGTEQKFDVRVPDGVDCHPDFNFFTKTNDVAVLTLDQPIDFDRICASPICLRPNDSITNGQKCIIAGWGATSENSRLPSPTLQSVSIPTYNGSDCATVFPNARSDYFSDPARQLCAGQPDVGGVDACGGDSGGPLMCQDPSTSTWQLAGITSYGDGCARANAPGVYANVAAYYDFISKHL